MAAHKTFIIKRKLAKAQKTNRPLPQWVRMKSGSRIRYNAKRRHWRQLLKFFTALNIPFLRMTNNSIIVGCNPIHLEEEHLVKLHFLISQISNDSKLFNNEQNLEQFQQIVKLYGDEPQLLDPALGDLVNNLVKHIKWPSLPEPFPVLDNSSIAALHRLRILSYVRGYKFLMRFLPHEFQLLDPVLSCLKHLVSKFSTSSLNSVEKNLIQILVIWLMIICKNPFNLTLHYNEKTCSNSSTSTTLADSIIHCLDLILESEIVDGGLSVVPTLLSQILTRPPVNISALGSRFLHFQQIFEKFESEADGGRQLINQLSLANALLKWGRRNDIKPFAEHLFSSLSKNFLFGQCPNILVRDLISKLLQRISLVLLCPKLATWRYRCGYRSIEETLKKDKLKENSLQGIHQNVTNENNEEEEEENIPYDLIEVILGQLLLKLNDRDNCVRWTSAKGIARICARIPLEMAAQVVSSIFKDIFEGKTSTQSSSSSWMGGCLVLAELCRRGCLLPEQVPKVISLVLSRSLIFESDQFGFMPAVNIRDASCYICWAFARAYEAKFLRQHLQPLAGTLLSIALFDREVNVRRAASASFQENVGRNNSFPHGIEVLQLIDFGAVAIIKHCYLELSVEVAKFCEYIHPMLNHLCKLKCQYWDESIRELAAEALQRLAPFDIKYSQNELLPNLIKKLNSLDINVQHGAFFAVSGLIEALSSQKCEVLGEYSTNLFEAVNTQSILLTDHRKKGFSLNAKSLCRIIRALCTVECVLTDEQLNNFHNILDTVIGEENIQLSKHAQLAFPSLMAYYKNDKNINKLIERIKFKYLQEIEKSFQTTETICCCNIRPLAFLLPEFFDICFDEKGTKLGIVVIEKLINVIIDQKTPKWVFARVAAIETICTFVSNSINYLTKDFNWNQLFNSLCIATDDFTLTTNGNIGRFTRRSAVQAIGKLLPLAFLNKEYMPIEQQLLDLAIGKIIERACESIDDLREKASTVLTNIVTIEEGHPLRSYISEFELLERIFYLKNEKNSEKQFLTVDWLQSKSFGRLSELLNSPTYGYYALVGFVFSAGSVCAWTRENAFLAIASYLKPFKRDVKFIEQFLNNLLLINLNIFEQKKLDQSPLLCLFKMLFIDGQLICLEQKPDNSKIFIKFCNLIFKLSTSKGKPNVKFEAINALGCLLQLSSDCKLYRRSLDLLLSMLKSPYISIREKSASQLFEAFSSLLDVEEEEEINIALNLLSKTDWSKLGINNGEEENIEDLISKIEKSI
ncbi:TFCD_C domain-containing [Meloidogyne graminicola]|uniref:Tubulin-specific chaperone D n=1 Tax=Meloidogyne graminicola TaxID=189291 RepID=A0A8S9ZLM6_9BILA|nr:TFCD_C domain-containing [Meloidogyne graminicola]